MSARLKIQARLVLGGARQLALFDLLTGVPQPRALIAAPKADPSLPRTFVYFSGDPIIIGLEPLIIGGVEDQPATTLLGASRAAPSALINISPPQQSMPSWREWRLTKFIRLLRTDRNLIWAVGWLGLGLACLAWLMHGGTGWASGLGQVGERALLSAPIAFCLLSVICMVASIIPDLDIVIMKLQVDMHYRGVKG
jgi:hypothetical protein